MDVETVLKVMAILLTAGVGYFGCKDDPGVWP